MKLLKDMIIFRWLKKMYNWVLGWAKHKYCVYALCVLAFIESIFFPIPPDVLFITMGAAKPKKALYWAFLMTVFSVLGGMIGYYIGWAFWNVTKEFFFTYVFSVEIFLKVQKIFQANDFVAIFAAGLSPIPYKVFTISAGVYSLNFPIFVLASILGRATRFFLVGFLLFKFGNPIKEYIDKYFEIFTIIFTVLLILGFYVIKYVI